MQSSVAELKERKQYLLKKVEDRTITRAEALELQEILLKEEDIRKLDDCVKFLIALGLGALGGYALTKLLEEERK
jgi:hypothetical protein